MDSDVSLALFVEWLQLWQKGSRDPDVIFIVFVSKSDGYAIIMTIHGRSYGYSPVFQGIPIFFLQK